MSGGYLGGHLSMTKGVGPAETVFDPGPTEWRPAADASLRQPEGDADPIDARVRQRQPLGIRYEQG